MFIDFKKVFARWIRSSGLCSLFGVMFPYSRETPTKEKCLSGRKSSIANRVYVLRTEGSNPSFSVSFFILSLLFYSYTIPPR